MSLDLDLDLDYRPRLGARRDFGIGIVGAGGIVQYAHLPAYRKAGFNVVGIYDKDPARAQATASAHGVERVYSSLEELLADPWVQIVDVAVYPWEQPAIVRAATAAGRHLLCQKPLALTYPEAVEAVRLARQAGVKLAVNQQMRWDAGMRASHTLIRRGFLGQPVRATIDVNILTPWHLWPWIYQGETIEVMYHSIHYLDTIRFLFGRPDRVYCAGGHHPGEEVKGETTTTTVLEWDHGMRGLVHVNHNNWAGDSYALYRWEGSDGVIRGTIGLLYNYPTGRPDTFEFTSRRQRPDYWFSAKLEDMWIPDAFIGTMGELMRAVEQGDEPENSGADNLQTLQMVLAAYRSMREHRAVPPDEIAQEATL